LTISQEGKRNEGSSAATWVNAVRGEQVAVRGEPVEPRSLQVPDSETRNCAQEVSIRVVHVCAGISYWPDASSILDDRMACSDYDFAILALEYLECALDIGLLAVGFGILLGMR